MSAVRDWKDLPNTIYWKGEYAPVLAAADLVVTDGPSMITESQVLSKPTIFLEREGHVEFNSIGERIVAGVHRVTRVADARLVAADIAATGDPLTEVQQHNSASLFGQPGAAQRIVDAILQEAQAERARA